MEDVNKPIKAVENRNPDGTFGKNNNANPLGRPKGKTLKERLKEKLALMSDEEMDEFLKGIAALDKWKMAEGNPANDTNLGNKDGKPFIIRIEPELAEQNGLNPSTINDSEGQEPI